MEKEMKTKTSRPLTRLFNRGHAAGSLYGIMVGEVFKRAKIKRSSIAIWLTCLSLASLCLLPGIMVGERVSAQSSNKKKGSPDLVSKAQSLTSTDTVKVIVQLRAPMSSTLNSLLNSNGVHVRKSFQNLGAHAVDMP